MTYNSFTKFLRAVQLWSPFSSGLGIRSWIWWILWLCIVQLFNTVVFLLYWWKFQLRGTHSSVWSVCLWGSQPAAYVWDNNCREFSVNSVTIWLQNCGRSTLHTNGSRWVDLMKNSSLFILLMKCISGAVMPCFVYQLYHMNWMYWHLTYWFKPELGHNNLHSNSSQMYRDWTWRMILTFRVLGTFHNNHSEELRSSFKSHLLHQKFSTQYMIFVGHFTVPNAVDTNV